MTGHRRRKDLDRFHALLASIDHVRADWDRHAACRDTEAGLFYPNRGGDTATPRSVCEGCVVQAECLTVALHQNERFGIWGGTSERQRRALRRQLTRTRRNEETAA